MLVPAILAALAATPAPAAPGGGVLQGAVQDAALAWQRGPDAFATWQDGRAAAAGGEALRVTIELVRGSTLDPVLADIEARAPGAWVEVALEERPAHPALIQALVPCGEILALADLSGARQIREPALAQPREVTTEGYDAMFLRDWHTEGATGARVHVAVLDVGFEGYEGLLGTELPRRVDTAFLASASGGDHGTAVAEILHDLAPEASLDLVSFSTESEYLEALALLAESGVDLVNASVGFDNRWPADGTSPFTRGADALAEDAGVLYVAAAGNENERYRIGALQRTTQDHVAVGGMSPVWVGTSGGYAAVSLRWSEPMGRADTDLDLLVADEEGEPCQQGLQGSDPQDGDDDPYEEVRCYTGGAWAQVFLIANGNAVDGLEGYLYAPYGLDPADATGSHNLTLPADLVHGLAVGAVDLPETGVVAAYSSRGPTEDGRVRPQLVAPSGVSTATRGPGGFGGTSAATPHVTGAAALALQAGDWDADPEGLRSWLVGQAVDLPPDGVDDASGAGFLTLDAIPWHGCHCASRGGPRAASGGSFVLALALLRRRRLR